MRFRTDRRRGVALVLAAVGAAVIAVCAVTSDVQADNGPGTSLPASGASPAATPSASPTPGAEPCHIAPVLDTFCSLGGAIDSGPGHLVTGAASDIGTSVVSAVTDWVAGGAGWILGQVATLLQTSTAPDLRSAWFGGQYATMAELAALLMVVFLLLATVHGLLHGDPGQIVRAFLLNAPAAVLGTLFAVAVVDRGIAATDAMTSAVSTHMQADLDRFTGHVVGALAIATAGNGGAELFVVFLGALAIALIGLVLWLELLVREAAMDICVLFLPLTLAASVWPATATWLRRLVHTLIAIVLSKFVIVAVLALAVSALAADASDGGIKAILVGVVLLALAAYSPYAVLRLLPAFESAGRLGRRALPGVAAAAASSHPGALAQRLVAAHAGHASTASGSTRSRGLGPSAAAVSTAAMVATARPGASRSQPPWLHGASASPPTPAFGAVHLADHDVSPLVNGAAHPSLDVRPRLDSDGAEIRGTGDE